MQEAGHPPIVGGHGGVPCTPQCSPAPLGGTWGLWVVSCGSPTPQCSLTPLWGSWGSPPVQHGPSPGVLGGFLGVSPHSSAAWPCSRGLGAVSQPPPQTPPSAAGSCSSGPVCVSLDLPPPHPMQPGRAPGGLPPVSHPIPSPDAPDLGSESPVQSHLPQLQPCLNPSAAGVCGGQFLGVGGSSGSPAPHRMLALKSSPPTLTH